MDRMTHLQKQVLKAAILELQEFPWFDEVCFEGFPDDEHIENDFVKAVAVVVENTVSNNSSD